MVDETQMESSTEPKGKGKMFFASFEGSNSTGRQDRTHEYSRERTNDFAFVCVLLCLPSAVRGFCMCVRALVFP